MKAITVKFLAATGAKGARLKAGDSDGNMTIIGYPHEVKSGEDAHFEAVKALCKKMKWDGEIVCGWPGNGSVWVFVEQGGGNQYLLPSVPKEVK